MFVLITVLHGTLLEYDAKKLSIMFRSAGFLLFIHRMGYILYCNLFA